ncbi:MAG: septation protein A [Pelagibacterales bacterium]|nr:septation protein A [Pelagibacterales bacterium]
MNKNLTKFFLDLGPLVIFFYFYKQYGMMQAIIPLIVATVVSVVLMYWLEKKIPMIPILGAILVSVFGGLTVISDNKIFFYMKPTIINLLLASILIFGKIILKKNLLKNLLQSSIQMTDNGWKELNDRWIYFFVFLAILNELIWRTQSENFWVQFKVFGIIPITLVFAILQISLIKKHRNQ